MQYSCRLALPLLLMAAACASPRGPEPLALATPCVALPAVSAPSFPAVEVRAPAADDKLADAASAAVRVTVRVADTWKRSCKLRIRWATDAHGSGEAKDYEAGITTAALADLPIGRVWVEVIARNDPDDSHATAVWLELEAAKRTDIAVNFDRGYSIRGRLIDQHGKPVVGREITFSEPTEVPMDMMLSSARADSRGMFRIEGLSQRTGALSLVIPEHPVGGGSQMVRLQYQSIDGVTPGSGPVKIVVREFDPNSFSDVIIW